MDRLDVPPFPTTNRETWYSAMRVEADKRRGQEGYKTSSEWYKELDAAKFDIVDMDGWRNEPDPEFYWYEVPILRSEYKRRVTKCTIQPLDEHFSWFSDDSE